MKTKLNFKMLLVIITVLFTSFILSFQVFSQSDQPSLAVINIDSRGLNIRKDQLGSYTYIEIEKLDFYNVHDPYDVEGIIKKNGLNISDCFGKSCLTGIGEVIKADKVLSGRVELVGDIVIVTFRLINVKTSEIERTHSKDFLNLQHQVHSMIRITLREMYQLSNDEMLEKSLTAKHNFESSINSPKTAKLCLDGPRMGAIYYTGLTGEILSGNRQHGGYDLYPAMFQFGYQMEVQYLNEGAF